MTLQMTGEKCPACAGSVAVVFSSEGTGHYEPYGELLLEDTIVCNECGELVACQVCGRPTENLARYAVGGIYMDPMIREPGLTCMGCVWGRDERLAAADAVRPLRKVTVLDGYYSCNDGAEPRFVLHEHGPTYRCGNPYSTWSRLPPSKDGEGRRVLSCRLSWYDLIPPVGDRKGKWTITVEFEEER
jgi:hypothetical protein